jgi:hypothetical protein
MSKGKSSDGGNVFTGIIGLAGIFGVVVAVLVDIATHNPDTAVRAGLVGAPVCGILLLIVYIATSMQEHRAEAARTWLAEEAAKRAARQAREKHLVLLRSGIGKIDQMQGIEFEQHVAARLRENGWKVSESLSASRLSSRSSRALFITTALAASP